MKLNLPSMNLLASEARRTFVRFPYVILSALIAAAYSIAMAENKTSPADDRLIFTITLGIPLFLSLTLLRESRGWNSARDRIVELIGGVLFLAAHHLLTLHDVTDNYLLRYLQLSLALHLLVAFIPFLKPGSENEFWQFNRFVFLRILLSTLYAAVFFGGISIALIAMEKLFSFDFKEIRFFELWLITVFILQTWHFLAGLPSLAALKGDQSYPKGLRVFVQYLLIPLVTLYMVILYCYMGKILLSQDWPQGYLAWLVSIMSVLGIFNLLLIDPEKNRTESRWIAAYSKFYYVLILPLLGMLFVAIGKRVSEYGVTEQRYFLIVLGALLSGLALYFIFSKAKNIKVIPISLFALAVVTMWGPWSAYSVSLRAQRARAQVILDKYKLLTKDADKKGVEPEEIKNLSSILDYLVQSHGFASVKDWFPDSLREPRMTAKPLMEHLGLEYLNRFGNRVESYSSFIGSPNGKPMDIAGYSHAMSLHLNKSESAVYFDLKGRHLSVALERHAMKVVVSEKGQELISMDLANVVKDLKGKQPEAPFLVVEGQGAGLQVRLMITAMSNYREGQEWTMEYLTGTLLFKPL